MMQTPFLLRHARTTDIAPLQILIELSVRGLQKDDYSPAQIEGALGHTLGLDTQLIEDQTYFVAEPRRYLSRSRDPLPNGETLPIVRMTKYL
jgi:hypothetical protein